MTIYNIYNSLIITIRDDEKLVSFLNDNECLNVYEEIHADEEHIPAVYIQLTLISEEKCIRHVKPLDFQTSLAPVATAIYDPYHNYVTVDKGNSKVDYMNITNIINCLREQIKVWDF